MNRNIFKYGISIIFIITIIPFKSLLCQDHYYIIGHVYYDSLKTEPIQGASVEIFSNFKI